MNRSYVEQIGLRIGTRVLDSSGGFRTTSVLGDIQGWKEYTVGLHATADRKAASAGIEARWTNTNSVASRRFVECFWFACVDPRRETPRSGRGMSSPSLAQNSSGCGDRGFTVHTITTLKRCRMSKRAPEQVGGGAGNIKRSGSTITE